jgi:hypothetical protein
MEFTAPNTPQQNGIVERQFQTDLTRANAMLDAAGLKPGAKNQLRAEAIITAAIIDNMTCKTPGEPSQYEKFFKKKGTLQPKHLIQFGRIGFVTIHRKISSKLKPKANKCIFVGYARNHSPNTYKMYNPATRAIILSRDIKWAECILLTQKRIWEHLMKQ